MFKSSELLLKNSHLKVIWGAKKEWRLRDFKISDVSVDADIGWAFLFVDNEHELTLAQGEELEKLLQEERNNFLSLLLLARNLLNLLNKAKPNGYTL